MGDRTKVLFIMNVGIHQEIKNSRFGRWLGSVHSRSKCCPIYTRLIFLRLSSVQHDWQVGRKNIGQVWTEQLNLWSCFPPLLQNMTTESNSSWHVEITKGLNSELIKHDMTSTNTYQEQFSVEQHGIQMKENMFFIFHWLLSHFLCIISWPLSLEPKK